MKNTFSLSVIVLLSIFLGQTFYASAQCTADCPPTPPLIFHDGGKPGKIPVAIGTQEGCYSSGANGLGMSFAYEYEPRYNKTPHTLTFTFEVFDLSGNPIQVLNPNPIFTNVFIIQISVGSLTGSPSGPYNAYLVKDNIHFDLDYTTMLPAGFPTDNVIRTTVDVREAYNKLILYSRYSYFDIPICHSASSRNGRTDLKGLEIVKSQPNPFGDYVEFQIQASESQQPKISVLNMQGQVVPLSGRSKYTGGGNWISSMNTSSLAAGVYVYRVQVGEKVYSQKIFKQ